MCGIWALIGQPCPDAAEHVNKLTARGPESCKLQTIPNGVLGFTRLAINGLNGDGMQPFTYKGITWICNGEIYNAKELATEYGITMPSGSDCEVLGPLFLAHRDSPASFFRALDGVFSIILYDSERDLLHWGRDPYGVRPLFCGWNISGCVADPSWTSGVKDFSGLTMQALLQGAHLESLCLSSERKAIPETHSYCMQFKPGCYASLRVSDMSKFFMSSYHEVPWVKNPSYSTPHPDGWENALAAVHDSLVAAVHKRMMTERPVAALLSGGIDSSLIAALVQKELNALGLPALKTFSIGMSGSSDLFYAKKVADWIGSDHHEVVLDADDFFDAIPTVIQDIESYDITTVRASVGNWLVSRAVRGLSDCKVVFNGDGSDEVFGSYLYFYNAPNDQAFEDEVERLLSELYLYDVLRSDRTISSHGLEPRTPFLDKQFVATCRSVATAFRRPVKHKQVEKFLLRSAFDTDGLLPPEVLWRRKEAFSDGVSSKEKSWYEEIQERVKKVVPSDWRKTTFEHCPPATEEAYYYRSLYEARYGSMTAATAIPRFWMPRWSPGVTDPSARALPLYSSGNSISASLS